MSALRIALAMALAWAAMAAARAQDAPQDQIVVRESVDPANPAVGEHVRLLVDVLFPDAMPVPPQVATPQAPGLQVFRFESQGTTMRDTIDQRPYVGQRFEFAVYPRRAGTLTVPAVDVRLMNRSGDETGRVHGEAQSLKVTTPPGLDPSKPVIASKHVSLKQSWQPDESASLHVGDALVRTIARTAADTPAVGFAPLDLRAPEGVRVYVDQPQTNDRVSRGDLTSERTDRITYVFERAGDFALPTVTQPWWDLSAKALRKESAAGQRVTIAAAAPSPDPQRAGLSRLQALGWRALTALAIAVSVVAALVGMAIAGLVARRRKRRESGPSEATLFRAFEQAANSGEPAATWRALVAWKAVANPPREAFARLVSIQALDQRLFGPMGGPWGAMQAQSLVWELQSLRREDGADLTSAARAALPPLNPAAPKP